MWGWRAYAFVGVLALPAACASFTAADDAAPAGVDSGAAGGEVSAITFPASCATASVFHETFSGATIDSSRWQAEGKGEFEPDAAPPGTFGAQSTDGITSALLLHQVTLAHPSTRVCIGFRLRIEADTQSFGGGYVSTIQLDARRALGDDTGATFIGAGVDKTGIFTNVVTATGGHIGQPDMTQNATKLTDLVYVVDVAATSQVTVLANGVQAAGAGVVPIPLTQLGEIDVEVGAKPVADAGATGFVHTIVDEIDVRAE